MPTVPGFEFGMTPPLPLVAIGHGALDPVISVDWGRRARQTLVQAGAAVIYREAPIPHMVDPAFLDELRPWLVETLGLDA